MFSLMWTVAYVGVNPLFIYLLDICPCVARGNDFVSMCTTMHVSYGLDEHINNFLSMSMTIHMDCGLDKHIKKYTNLIT